MVFVGPHPVFYNQDDLMTLRVAGRVQKLKPVITGCSQINGREELSLKDKAGIRD